MAEGGGATTRRPLAPTESARFFLGGALGGRNRFEAIVRYGLSAFDREAVGAVRNARLRALDCCKLFAEVSRKSLVELVLIQIGAAIELRLFVRFLARVLMTASREKSLDSLSLGGQQFACSLGVHLAPRYQPLLLVTFDDLGPSDAGRVRVAPGVAQRPSLA
jgi:hypothetical protein